MNYKDNEMYKAYLLKKNMLEDELSGTNHEHTILKANQFIHDVLDEQQETIKRLQEEKRFLVEFLQLHGITTVMIVGSA